MTYSKILTLATVAALIAAGIAAFGTTIGLHTGSPTAGWLVPALVGIGLAVLLAAGWHVVLHGAAHSRHKGGITATILGGLLLAFVALGASGWALATTIGGETAQGIYHQQVLQEHEAALTAASERTKKQQPVVDQLTVTATAYTGFAESEERGDYGAPGCGPQCNSYKQAGETMQQLRDDTAGVLEAATRTFEDGRAALSDGRQAISEADEKDFGLAMAAVAETVAELNAVNIIPRVTSGGIINWEQANGAPTAANRDNLTEAVKDVAESVVTEPVPVPTFAPMTRGEAVIAYRDRVPGAWIVAAAVDLSPLVLLLLVMAYAREPLVRQIEARQGKTDADVVQRELTLVGKARA